MRTALVALAWLLGAGALLAGLFLLSFRTGFRPVLDAVRRFNRGFNNPRQMRTAGQPGSYAGIVEHVGRRSGTTYRTPIGIVRTDDGLLVTLPYGTGTDWLRNVRAAGTATVTVEGEVIEVDQPRIVSREAVAEHLSPGDARTATLFGIDDFLLLHERSSTPLPSSASARGSADDESTDAPTTPTA